MSALSASFAGPEGLASARMRCEPLSSLEDRARRLAVKCVRSRRTIWSTSAPRLQTWSKLNVSSP